MLKIEISSGSTAAHALCTHSVPLQNHRIKNQEIFLYTKTNYESFILECKTLLSCPKILAIFLKILRCRTTILCGYDAAQVAAQMLTEWLRNIPWRVARAVNLVSRPW